MGTGSEHGYLHKTSSRIREESSTAEGEEGSGGVKTAEKCNQNRGASSELFFFFFSSKVSHNQTYPIFKSMLFD